MPTPQSQGRSFVVSLPLCSSSIVDSLNSHFVDSKRRRLRSPRRRRHRRTRPRPPIRARTTPHNPFHLLILKLRLDRTYLSPTPTGLATPSRRRSQPPNLLTKAATKRTRLYVPSCGQCHHPKFHPGSLGSRSPFPRVHPTSAAPHEPVAFLRPA